MPPLHALGLCEVRDLIARGEVTSLDVAQDLIATIEERDPALHAYLEVAGDETIAAARELVGAKEARDVRAFPLFGVPIAVKDNICTVGTRTTCGSRVLEHYRSPYAATAVERLTAAGALVVGKTNLDEFGMGSSTENSSVGATRNPWNAQRVPGGSSGGSAAAVAADMAFAALGSDTGGSIRQPASFCGVVGVKPTYGRVSRYGLVAFASSLDQVGPIAKNVRDAALVLKIVCGRDERDATSLAVPPPDTSLERGLEGLTVGIPRAFLEGNLDRAVAENLERVARDLEASGVTVRGVDLPSARHAVATYYVLANAEASANLARFDGVRYGYRAPECDDLISMVTRTRSVGFGAEVKRRVLLGTYVLSAGYYDAYYAQAQKVRSLAIEDFDRALAQCDVVMTPTAPTPAFELGEKTEDPVAMYQSDVLTIPASLAGLPAVSIPSGLSDGRLPLGVQLVGRALDEETVLRAAYGVERVVDFQERAYAG
jgi:aspartyl-tRNA(Asn)/glutamyl-tRNA(Gln) amidotransferase subunit A